MRRWTARSTVGRNRCVRPSLDQVRDRDGQPVVSKMLQAGQSHTLFAESGLELSTGSIENLTIRIDGQKVRVPVRNPEMVVTTVPLDASSLQSFGVSAD